MEREYLGGDVITWRRDGKEMVAVERIGSLPNGWISLYCTSWLTPQEAREVAKALNAYAETIEQDKGYCHDPFKEEA